MQFKLPSKKITIILSIAVVILGAWFWRVRSQKPVYDEYTVQTSDLSNTLELSGSVSAGQSATLRFLAGGLITYLGAKEGDQVKKWSTLASVDTRQLQKVLEEKLNLYAIQRGTFDQTIDDNDNSIPEGDLARTLERLLAKNQYQLENTVKDVEYQDLTIQLSRLTSPISGILVHAPISVANVQVTAADNWIVVDPQTLEFIADLDETDLSKVSVGQKALITLDAFPDELIESTISSIAFSPKETTTGTTYEVKVSLPASFLAKLRLGLNGTAAIVLSEKFAVPTLPSSAFTFQNGQMVVKILRSGKYLDQTIETGIENAGQVEILDGLKVGDHVYAQK